MNQEYIVNRQGAKVYLIKGKQPELLIPVIKTTNDQGLILEVLSVGMIPQIQTPIVTVNIKNEIIAYALPEWYKGWVQQNIDMALNGAKLFPCKVEFGFIETNNQYYAQFI